ncbi:type II toxin-antitoxin system VapC family toxin [Bosea sp. (in: a-proteobacteria)]|uniref:type II toxin-antitoxin system VapC family toxin n=1 Tax=Bosea sp. (in: a-proteobacteria) TaxID=1871050 RepID=UPI002736CB5B|nr:type II toxin-antitoxin system VapC family toxin [Bosea sp. (in: a-proteobacteria)]MDP3408940.1 type II toxin-antitoxin system VapC family toxin [Bosea sp. (in: a-proteobacteria)]
MIDSNVLLDVMTEDPRWFAWSAHALEQAADRFRLVINPVVYAEVSVRYTRIEDVDAALPRAMIDREPIPFEAAFLAGKCFLTYRRRGGTKLSPLSDFFIGAHAAVAGYQLMTRDAARYRTYFPNLSLLAPEEPWPGG